MSPQAIPDARERERALDPLTSFCVTAPAGSGKTELLIQRFLTLLARVDQPEQILAITFTRKAAAEMTERIVVALQEAAEDSPVTAAHALHTRTLARAALARDTQCQWHLLQNPSRLNLKTIDSFSAGLTRQLPVLSGFGGAIAPTDQPEEFYREAARALLDMLEEGRAELADLRALLLHYDNNWSKLESLLVRTLQRRDQWLAYMGARMEPISAERALYATVNAIVEDGINAAFWALGGSRTELQELLDYSLGNLGNPLEHTTLEVTTAALPAWRALVRMLMTEGATWRKRLDKNMGFPPDAGQGKAVADAYKDRLKQMIAELSGRSNIQLLLTEVLYLPETGDDIEHWQMLLRLSRLLPLLAARLSVVFQAHGVVDYPQIAMAAREALGDDENPTDVAMKLDYRLQHILLDEFQDTAIGQFELVRRLTRGWAEDNEANPGNPKTFFIVGDGMQSIYGFRDADVGLFMHAQENGFNGIEPETLVLSSNFRSDPSLVAWVNDTFASAFPAENDIRTGAIAFSPANAVRPGSEQAQIETLAFVGEEAVARQTEADELVKRIQLGLASDGCESIAVLVSSRSHLQQIVQLLRQRDIPWTADTIDPLKTSPVVVDLVNLCHAIHNLGDRAAWMALLRAPWCGLELADLLVIAGKSGSGIWHNLNRSDLVARLSTRGQLSVTALQKILGHSLERRELYSLRALVEDLWTRLNGPATVIDALQLDDALAFFELLEEFDKRGETFSPTRLDQYLDSLYSASSGTAKVQLMTLHKSKGLEFDWVIIPGLGRKLGQDKRELLVWDTTHNRLETGFLLAVDEPGKDKEATLYRYLTRQRSKKREHESTRLLYVGATRAIKRLIISATMQEDDKGEGYKPPCSGTLLACIADSFSAGMQVIESGEAPGPESHEISYPPLRRLRRPPDATALSPARDSEDRDNIPDRPDNHRARAIGTVIHLSLERLSRVGSEQLHSFDAERWQPWWFSQLRVQGVHESELQAASLEIAVNIERVLADQRGQWILSADGEEALSEFSLTSLREDGRLSEQVIDRAFVDEGVRWIIDYKSAAPGPGESLQDFLQREKERYLPQLDSYRQLFESWEGKPVKIALYFTSIPHFLECNE